MAEFPSLRLRIALMAYGLLWYLFLPFALLYLCYRGRRDADYCRHIAERFGLYPRTIPGAVWIHAVSLGELRSAVPLIRALLARGEKVVITHFTPAGRRESLGRFALEIAEGRVAVVWVPFEFSWCFSGLFRFFKPKYGLVMEVEIWPRMIMAARAAGVPLFMCNAQYPSKSFERDGKTGLRAQIMRGFAGALVKSDLQRDRFAAAGVSPIVVTGELRFDQPIPPAQVAAGMRLKPLRETIILASVVKGEDEGYINVIKSLEKKPLIIYVPRAPERFDEVALMLTQAGLRLARRSDTLGPDLAGEIPADIDVLLGDTLGEMYFYLSLADRVVVGGGFTPAGAHNIIEPLALCKPVVTGPEVFTIEYPFVEASAAGVARKVNSFHELKEYLESARDPSEAAITSFFAAHSGATDKTLAAIDKLTRR